MLSCGQAFQEPLLRKGQRRSSGGRILHPRLTSVWRAVGLVLVVTAVAWDFAVATTFIGDDYIFRVFARLETNPFVAFVADKHGGEYYRPIPMLLWWLLERASSGQAWLFALAGFVLHAACAVLVGMASRVLGMSRDAGRLAGVLFFVAPAEREAALWFSANTDLLSTAGLLGAFVLFFTPKRWARILSVLCAALAIFSKETGLVLVPLLAAGVWFQDRRQGRAASAVRFLRSLWPCLVVATGYLGLRSWVLHGLGGTNDPVAPGWARAVQLLGGLVHAVTAYAPCPEWLAWLGGGSALVVATIVARRRSPSFAMALAWVVITLLPLPAAGWVVGARYFYLPAVGLMMLLASALEATPPRVVGVVVTAVLGLGFATGAHRAGEVRLYRQAVVSANLAVRDGIARGHRLFLVRGAVKDLDLAIKLSADRGKPEPNYVVLADVPASFVWLPDDFAARLQFLMARPPLPPSGAYRFGGGSVAGQARREDAPDLDEVLGRLPELRIIRLRQEGAGFSWSDRTDEYHEMIE
jgi:hypothetical protein